jgi:hypothetical protein
MSEDKNEKLPKFAGKGYTLWKRRMDLVFAHHELLDVVEIDPLTINPTASFVKKDYRAKYLYQACVSDEVFEEICDCEYATKMHTALDKKYNVKVLRDRSSCKWNSKRSTKRLLPTTTDEPGEYNEL